MKAAIIAALPREVKALVKGWERREVAHHVWVWTNGSAVVACAGMGAARVTLAAEAAIAAMPVTDLISTGVAGACNPKLRVGDVVRASVVLDGATGEGFEDTQHRAVLVSVASVAGVREKAQLLSKHHADAVDMEAATVARIARERGLGFHAIKTISDAADFELEDMESFVTEDGQFKEAAFALHAALRPARWGKVMALARNSSIALGALTRELQATLDWYKSRD